MTSIIEFLSNLKFVMKHLSAVVRLGILIVAAISTAAISVAMYGSSEAKAVKKDLMELRSEDMRRLETKLDKIENDTEFVKRFLIENAARAR